MAHVGIPGWIHLLLFGIVVPVLVLRSKRRLDADHPLPAFKPHTLSAVLTLVLFGGLSVLVARVERLELFPRRLPEPWTWAVGLIFLFIALVVLRPYWRRAVVERRAIVRLFAPRDATERAWWVVASLTAGASEEITWRGVQFQLLWIVTGSGVAAAVISAAMFGAAHLVQGRRTAWVIVAYALAAQALVWIAGSLYVAIVIHALYDLIAGFAYGRLATELGYFTDGPSLPASAPDPGSQS